MLEIVDRLEKGGSLNRSLGMAFPTIPKAYDFEAATQSICHSRESGNPLLTLRSWIPAFAGMTTRIGQCEYLTHWKKDLQLPGHYGKHSLKPSGRSLKSKTEFPDNMPFVVSTS